MWASMKFLPFFLPCLGFRKIHVEIGIRLGRGKRTEGVGGVELEHKAVQLANSTRALHVILIYITLHF